nr:unnamed protein product [Spirometra erinaceieuropaei]
MKPNPSQLGHPEDLLEAPATEPGQLGRPGPRRTDLEEDTEDWRITLRNQSHQRREAQPETGKSQMPPRRLTTSTPNRYQRVHDTNCSTPTAATVVSSSTSSSPPTLSTNVDRPPEPPLRSFSSFSTVSTPAIVASAMPINNTHNPVTPTNTNTITFNTRNEHLVYTCSYCDHTFNLHIGLVGHLRTYRTETGKPASETPPTLVAFASTVHTTLTHSLTEWAYSAKCVFIRAELTAAPSHPPHLPCLARPTPPPSAPTATSSITSSAS